MRRWSRAVVSAGMALSMVGAMAAPGFAANPKPLPAQWWFDIWGVEKDLWPHGKGQGVTVAVIDTGVQASLPALSGAVLPGTSFEAGVSDPRTDNHMGFDRPGHGTRMATLIAARATGTGFVGVAPEAKILPIVGQSSAATTKGIRYAVDNGAKVINISQTTPGACPADLQEAVAHAIEKNVVIVAASGNDGNSTNYSHHPANCAGVISVGAADIDVRPWEKTQRQPYVDIAGPGVRASGLDPDGTFNNNRAGTSQAAALTSAVVAVIRSAHPDWTNREVTRQLIASAKDIGPPGKDNQTGYGFTRPYRIFKGMIPKNTGNPVFEEYDRWAQANGRKKAAEPESTAPPLGGSTDVPTIVFFVGLVVVFGGGVALAFFKARRGPKKLAGAGQVGPIPGAPPSFGGPPPPQGYGAPPQPQQPGGFAPGAGQQYPQQYPPQGPPQGGSQTGPQSVPPQGGQSPQTQLDIPTQPPPQQGNAQQGPPQQ